MAWYKTTSKWALRKLGQLSLGVTKFAWNTAKDSYALFRGDKTLIKLAKKLDSTNHVYQAKRRKMSGRYPYIDSAVLSGLTLAEMARRGVPEDVSRAYELAFSTQSETSSFIETWQGFSSHEERLGFINAMKGKLFEVKYVDHLNETLEPGYSARLAETATQSGWDIEIVGPDQALIDQIQLKATTSVDYVRDAIEAHPHIDVVTLEDLQGHMALSEVGDRVTTADLSNSELLEELSDATAFNMEALPPLLALGFVVFSAYRAQDLTDFQRTVRIGERGGNVLLNSGILLFTGLPGIPIVFAKEYFLKKGARKRADIDQLKRQIDLQRKSYRLWDKRMSRRRLIRGLVDGVVPV